MLSGWHRACRSGAAGYPDGERRAADWVRSGLRAVGEQQRYSDLVPVAHFDGDEWVGTKTVLSLNNTIGSPVLDLFAASDGWTYKVDSQGLVHPDDPPVPEPASLCLFAAFTTAFLVAARRRPAQK